MTTPVAGSVQLANGAKCICGNSDATKIRRYYDREDDEILGCLCLQCECEYLNEKILVSTDDRYELQLGMERLLLTERSSDEPDGCGAHMVHAARTEICNVEMFGDYLKPGDHIAWCRSYGIWHHALVAEIDTENNRIGVIHWNGDKATGATIKEELIDLKKENGDLYRMNYEEHVMKENPAKLVIARARSRLGDENYSFFGDNCEAFVTYCKEGLAKSQQVCWLLKDVNNRVKAGLGASPVELVRSGCKIAKATFLRRFGQVGSAETVEAIAGHCQWVGLGLVVIIEGAMTIYDINSLYTARKKGEQSKKDFTEQVTRRVTEAFFAGGLAAAGGLLPGIGIFVGVIGGVTGKIIGSFIGRYIGRAITYFIKTDDRAISSIEDLRTGDQIVLYAHFTHPRHHCIVLWYDETEHKANVIHSTYERGVVQEWMDIVQPVYKVVYQEHESHPPETVCDRAISKLGTNDYNLITNNCKHFSEWCKKK